MSLQAPVEKASIDEVYIDLTSMVEAELQSLGAGVTEAGGDANATAGFGVSACQIVLPGCET